MRSKRQESGDDNRRKKQRRKISQVWREKVTESDGDEDLNAHDSTQEWSLGAKTMQFRGYGNSEDICNTVSGFTFKRCASKEFPQVYYTTTPQSRQVTYRTEASPCHPILPQHPTKLKKNLNAPKKTTQHAEKLASACSFYTRLSGGNMNPYVQGANTDIWGLFTHQTLFQVLMDSCNVHLRVTA